MGIIRHILKRRRVFQYYAVLDIVGCMDYQNLLDVFGRDAVVMTGEDSGYVRWKGIKAYFRIDRNLYPEYGGAVCITDYDATFRNFKRKML